MSVPAVPGDTTSNPQASVPHVTTMGRCARCERWPWEPSACEGTADVVHVGS
jgi:hypothetical protein